MQDQDTVNNEENVLNILFTEVDENGDAIENGIQERQLFTGKIF